ncbi:MAG: HlyD family secretion protein [Lachnospirales bacterium]
MKKGIKIGILLLICAVIGVYMAYTLTAPITVETIKLEEKYASYYFTEEGIVGNQELYNIYSKNAGDVKDVYVSEGDFVNKGDKIGEISGSQLDFEIKTCEQQIEGYNAQKENVYLEDSSRKSTINSSIDELNSQLATLEVQEKATYTSKDEQIAMQELLISQTEKELDNLKKELDKYSLLLENEVVSKAEYDKIATQVETYENLLLQNKKQLDILKTEGVQSGSEYFDSTKNAIEVQITNMQSELNKDYITPMINYYNSLIEISKEQINILNQNKEELIIISPFDGIVAELPLSKVNYVTQATPVAIIKQEDFLIETSISTRDIDSIDVGSKVNIIIDKRQGEERYVGNIVSIENEAIAEISNLGVEERKVKVTIEPKEELNLMLGFDVDIEFLLYENENAVVVPKESIFNYEDGFAVYKVENGVLKATMIERGVELRNEYVIDKGITASDIIVKDASVDGLEEGKKISSN